MKKILFIISLLFLIHNLQAKTITVSENGKIRTIAGAIKIANNNDTILIKKGTYYETDIIVDKSITIIGENYPIVDGKLNGEIFTIVADSVTIKGMQIQNTGVSYIKDIAGIYLKKCKNVNVINNRLYNTLFAIYLENSADCLIKGNTVKGTPTHEAATGNAIHLWYCKRITIEANNLQGHRDGIYLEFVENSRISKNNSEANLRYGLHFMFSNHDEYFDNVFKGNGTGVAVMYSKHIKMYNNTFYNNWASRAYGILIKEIYDSELINNVFENNTIAVFVDGSNRILFKNNVFRQNGWAVKILGNCENNVFTENNFISNSFDVLTNSKSNFENKFEKNYWSAYNGYDLNKDKIGDVPYHPVSLFSHIVETNPTAIILLRSLFVYLLDIAEKITPVLSPASMSDEKPLLKKAEW